MNARRSLLAGPWRRVRESLLGTTAEVITVVALNIVMLMLLELPLLVYTIAPEWTPIAIERFIAWLNRSGRRALVPAPPSSA